MHKESIIEQTKKYAKKTLKNGETSHNWWHADRVWKNAISIGKEERVDMFVVQLAALLHDIADWKFQGGDNSVGPKLVREWLESLEVEEAIISHVCEIIKDTSFKGAEVKSQMNTREGMVVQDADRLDAMGAIGIARTFTYGGHIGREIYDPEKKLEMHESFESYKKNQSSSINHFYEKLLFLKNLMNTKTGRKIAEKRHKFMEQFLDEFLKEWEDEN